MKKIIIISFLLLWVHAVHATIYRLGYPDPQTAGIDFAWNDYSSLEAAASSGDTVHVYQHFFPLNSGISISVYKTLHFIGYGYNLNKNASLQVVTIPDSVYNSPITLVLEAGSAGSTVQGLYLSDVWLKDNNLSIRRCKIQNAIFLQNASAINNISINACYSNLANYPNGFVVDASYSSDVVANLNIRNNFMGGILLRGGSSGSIANNVFVKNSNYVNVAYFAGTTSNFAIKNNIVTNDAYGGCFFEPSATTGLISRNVFAYPGVNCPAVAGNGNVYGASMSTTFSNWNNGDIYNDAQLTLQTSSTAFTNGRTNANAVTQCGLFGGETADFYVLSGIPAVPAIYSNTFSSVLSNTGNYTGTISTRSNSTSNINRIEYYIDTDPGYGLATSVSAFTAATNIVNKSVTITGTGISSGYHTLVFRSRDTSGKWSLDHVRTFYKQQATPATIATSNITKLEYFLDNDPGLGAGTNISITAGATVNTTLALNTTSINSGIHTAHFRARNAAGSWSLVNTWLFLKPVTSSAVTLQNITRLEYFIDDDPGIGLGTNISITASTNIANLTLPLNVTSTSAGVHRLCVRARNAAGSWSLVNSWLFYKPYTSSTSSTALANLTRIEYFIDTDPGLGEATAVAFSAGTDVQNLIIPLDPTSMSAGIHRISVRAKDANGVWSMVNTKVFYKPYTSSPTPTTTPNLVRLEYSINEAVTLGGGTSIPIPNGIQASNIILPLNPTDYEPGENFISFRTQDANGNWSLVNKHDFNVYAPAVSTTPLPLNGFNYDVIAEVAGDATNSTNNSFDYGYAVLMAQSYNPTGTYYLPNNGLIQSAFRPGVQFQLNPFTGNNTLSIDPTNQNFNLSLNSPVSAKMLYFLASSGNGSADLEVTLNFADASTQAGGSYIVPDWYDGNHYAIKNIGRTYRIYNYIEEPEDNPRLYVFKLEIDSANQSKPISSISFNKISGGKVNILAISRENECSGTPNPGNTLASASSICIGDSVLLTLQNPFLGAGINYQWQSADNSTFTAGVQNLGLSYSEKTAVLTTKYYRCAVACNAGTLVYSTPVQVSSIALPTVSINGASSVCDGSSLTLTANGALTYTWEPTSETTVSINPSPSVQTTYMVTGTSANGCKNTATHTVSINPLPVVTATDVQGCAGYPITLIGSPVGGTFSQANPYTGPSANYTYTYTDAAGCANTSAAAQIDIVSSVIYYQDADNDGYGNPNVSLTTCTTPSGYVYNNEDCDDTDSLEQPYQIWYIDNDDDDYGTGYYVQQCIRPSHGYLPSELQALTGDCDDNNASINPGAQYFTFSTSPNFTNALMYPTAGSHQNTYQFEVIYHNASNGLPPLGFPRVVLDYENNGYYADANDRTIVMTEADVNDITTNNGKKYIATASNLVSGTNYATHVVSNAAGCETKLGTFNYPDVLILPDVEIFANDITFSTPNPAVASALTIDATIHNETDYAANNFVVRMRNQYDTTIIYPDITVPTLAPHSNITVSWNITTPGVPAWCPIEVTIDYTNVIAETNELDNSAIRPFINGNFNLPGGIHVYPYASPAVSYHNPGSYVSINGNAYYWGTPVPLLDSNVAGATVEFTIQETNATYTGYTDSWGGFSIGVPQPPPGVYHVNGTVTDFTFTENFSTIFEVLPPTSCPLDFQVGVAPYQVTILQGNSINGAIYVSNGGVNTSAPTTIYVAQSGGTPSIGSFSVPALAPGASHTYPCTLYFASPGGYQVCAYVDPSNAQAECIESNNEDCGYINVLPALPDIVPYQHYIGTQYRCQVSEASFTLQNVGGVATGSFTCTILTRLNGTLINTQTHNVPNIGSVLSANNLYSFSLPFIPAVAGNYSFELQCDLPANAVLEVDENNNIATYYSDIIDCQANLYVKDCEWLQVESPNDEYTLGTTITLKGRIQNNGNLDYNGNVDVRFKLKNGTTINQTHVMNLTANGQNYFDVSATCAAPAFGVDSLTITVDPSNQIAEASDDDNSTQGAMCWDLIPAEPCGPHFWDFIYQQYHTMFLSVGVVNAGLYEADTVRVKFEVSGPGISGTQLLGYANLEDINRDCQCPHVATLPTSFAFQNVGTYTFTMTVDPDSWYSECDELNNVMVRNVVITDLPDMRVLSQFIAPSMLNPQPNQPITMNVTYENMGRSNQADHMKLNIYVDNDLFASINPTNGLLNGDDTTIAITGSYFSNLVGVHVIRAHIDADSTIQEYDETNNEATRAIVVGESANLHYQILKTQTLNPTLNQVTTIQAKIGNSGDLDCEADVQFFYVNNASDTILIGTKHVNALANSFSNTSIPWYVVDNQTTIVSKIVNSSILEYTYDDNDSAINIGSMILSLSGNAACDTLSKGNLSVYVSGGNAPYTYSWSNSDSTSNCYDSAGIYTVVVTDANGVTVSMLGSIDLCPNSVLNVKCFIQGYYVGSQEMQPVLLNQSASISPVLSDSIQVSIHDAITLSIIESHTIAQDVSGNAQIYLNSITLGESYYISIKHRNSIETWSATPVTITNNTIYNFTDAASKAYGNNQVEVEPNVFAFYSGDMDQNGYLELDDYNLWDVEYQAGYPHSNYAPDLDGNGYVELDDYNIWDLNYQNGVYIIRP